METILTIRDSHKEIAIIPFDDDKELEICIKNISTYQDLSMWLSPNQVNSIIIHLAEQLELIGEPIELLNK